MNQQIPYAPSMGTTQKTSGLAITSLVFGILDILGLAICGGSFIAIICGHLALSKIKRSGGMIGGRGLAVAGLVLGYLSLAVGIVIAMFFLGIAGLGAKIESDQRQRDVQRQSQDAERARAAVGDLQQYTGTFQDVSQPISVLVQNNTLKTSSATNLCELRPLEKDLFVFQKCTKSLEARLQFNRNASGAIIGMTIRHYDLSNNFCKKIQ